MPACLFNLESTLAGRWKLVVCHVDYVIAFSYVTRAFYVGYH